MRGLCLADVVDIDTYEHIRPGYRARILDHKQPRRVSVGPCVSLVFEDRETLRYQILEMIRVERTTDPEKVQTEIDVYNDLMPGENELSATLFIEIPELDRIRSELDRLIGIDEAVSLVFDPGAENESCVPGRFDPSQLEADRISAVHYLRFSLRAHEVERFESGGRVGLRIDHPNYRHAVELDPATRASLLCDLRDATPELLDAAALPRARSRAATEPNEGVRVRTLPALGSRTRMVVEARDPAATLATADPGLLSELMRTAREVARDLHARTGRCRIRMETRADAPGGLRIELSAPLQETEKAPSRPGRRDPKRG
jgi:hypothetical protein